MGDEMKKLLLAVFLVTVPLSSANAWWDSYGGFTCGYMDPLTSFLDSIFGPPCPPPAPVRAAPVPVPVPVARPVPVPTPVPVPVYPRPLPIGGVPDVVLENPYYNPCIPRGCL